MVTASQPDIAPDFDRAIIRRYGIPAEATPGTRFMLMAGKPYGETPIYNGPYVD